MKKILVLFFPGLLLNICLYAQNQDLIIVKAGTAFLDYFTIAERYLYPEFKTGIILFKTNTYTERKFNYNYLIGEIEFLENSDTLSLKNREDIKSIIVEQDTFFYDRRYILQIKSNYPKIGLNEFIEFKEIQKKDSYGIVSSGGSTFTLNSIAADGNYYKLKANHDLIFERTRLYYISTFGNTFVPYTKKNVFKLFSRHREKVKSFLKNNKIKFDSGDDLLRLAEYLGTL